MAGAPLDWARQLAEAQNHLAFQCGALQWVPAGEAQLSSGSRRTMLDTCDQMPAS